MLSALLFFHVPCARLQRLIFIFFACCVCRGPKLVELRLTGTYITCEGLTHLTACPNLRVLYVDQCWNILYKYEANQTIIPAIKSMDGLQVRHGIEMHVFGGVEGGPANEDSSASHRSCHRVSCFFPCIVSGGVHVGHATFGPRLQ
jgi:hypothetical protein